MKNHTYCKVVCKLKTEGCSLFILESGVPTNMYFQLYRDKKWEVKAVLQEVYCISFVPTHLIVIETLI